MLFSLPARAEQRRVWLELARGENAEQCPDVARVWQRLDALFPQRRLSPSADRETADVAVSISVSREAQNFEARFEVAGESTTPGHLVDQDPQCRGLSDALAVALMLRLDSEREPAASKPAQRAVPRTPSAPPLPPARSHSLFFSADSGAMLGDGALGSLGQASWGATVGAALFREGPGVRVELTRLVQTPLVLAQGSVHVDLWAGMLGPCWRFGLNKRWALEPCLELGIGRQRGVAQDFPVNRQASATWVALLPNLALQARILPPLGTRLALGSTLRLRGQRYAIDGQVIDDPDPLGFYAVLGLSLGWDIRQRE
ncbi:MAG: hypothetical protein QM756_35160 [Polyangiaceae bacterium]